MTLTAHPVTVSRRSNEAVTVTVPIYSTEPGTVTASAPGCTFPDGNQKAIVGMRAWRNGLKHGQYLARKTSDAAGRKDVSLCLEIDWTKVISSTGALTSAYASIPAVASIAYDKQRMINWGIALQIYKVADATQTYRIIYYQSNAASAGEATFSCYATPLSSSPPTATRIVITLPDPATDSKIYNYWTTGTASDLTLTGRVVTDATMGGNQALVMSGMIKVSKFARMLSQADREGFVQSGTIPATPELSYQGGHEVVETAPVFWDTSGNNLDLFADSINLWPPAAASGDYTDSVPVVPASSIRVTIPAGVASPVTLELSRERANVPPRASEAERIEKTTGTITLTTEAETITIGPDVTCQVPSYPQSFDLLIASNYDGSATVVSNNAALVPTSPVTISGGVAVCACTVTADVTAATVTATGPGGDTDEAIVSVHDVLTGDWIAAGPNCRTRIEGKRIVWPIRVRSSKDGDFTAAADPPTGIIIAGPFEIASGACDITAQPTQAGSWVLTVAQDGRTDSVTLEALAAAAPPTVRQYNLSADIDGFFDFINRKYGFRPRFTPANVQDVRAEHSTDRTFSRYAQGSGQPGSVFGAVALSYQVMISYSSVTMAEQDLGILREEADRYGWNCIGFSMTGQTMFEPIKMMPRLTLTLNFDIIPQGR